MRENNSIVPTKLSMGGNTLIIPTQGEFGVIPAGDGNVANLLLLCDSSVD